MNPMILKLVPSPDWDNVKFVVDLSYNRPISFEGCKLLMVTNVCESFKEEIKHEILKIGLAGILGRTRLDEALTAPGMPKNEIRDLLIDFLQSIDTHGELVIVDPYFFASTQDGSYPQYILEILTPFLSVLTTLRIVTLPDKIDTVLRAAIVSLIAVQNPNLRIDCRISKKFHDRFWLSDSRTQGIVTGSSLNGLGKRYALVDRLSSSDVKDIAGALQKEGI